MTSGTKMAPSSETSTNNSERTFIRRFGMHSVTKEDVCFKVLPAIGSLSYEMFSVHVMNPNCFRNLFSEREVVVANSLWFNAHIGMGLFMFGSQHLQHASVSRKILYSVFGAFLFNFGSVLFWATCKSLFFPQPAVRTIFGLGSGFVLLYIGREYVNYIDAKFSKK